MSHHISYSVITYYDRRNRLRHGIVSVRNVEWYAPDNFDGYLDSRPTVPKRPFPCSTDDRLHDHYLDDPAWWWLYATPPIPFPLRRKKKCLPKAKYQKCNYYCAMLMNALLKALNDKKKRGEDVSEWEKLL